MERKVWFDDDYIDELKLKWGISLESSQLQAMAIAIIDYLGQGYKVDGDSLGVDEDAATAAGTAEGYYKEHGHPGEGRDNTLPLGELAAGRYGPFAINERRLSAMQFEIARACMNSANLLSSVCKFVVNGDPLSPETGRTLTYIVGDIESLIKNAFSMPKSYDLCVYKNISKCVSRDKHKSFTLDDVYGYMHSQRCTKSCDFAILEGCNMPKEEISGILGNLLSRHSISENGENLNKYILE